MVRRTGGDLIPNGALTPRDPVPPAPEERLDSWKEIAGYLKRSVRTVTRWEQEHGLPVHRHSTGAVYGYRPEIDAWWAAHRKAIENESAVPSGPPSAVPDEGGPPGSGVQGA